MSHIICGNICRGYFKGYESMAFCIECDEASFLLTDQFWRLSLPKRWTGEHELFWCLLLLGPCTRNHQWTLGHARIRNSFGSGALYRRGSCHSNWFGRRPVVHRHGCNFYWRFPYSHVQGRDSGLQVQACLFLYRREMEWTLGNDWTCCACHHRVCEGKPSCINLKKQDMWLMCFIQVSKSSPCPADSLKRSWHEKVGSMTTDQSMICLTPMDVITYNWCR